MVLATGGYSNAYFLSTNAKGCNVTATWRAHRKGALFANPCYTQIHPTCIPRSSEAQSKLTLMSESLRNDGRIWVPRERDDGRRARDIPPEERYYYLEERYPAFGNLVPRDVASRNAKQVVDEGNGVGALSNGVFLDFADAIERLGREAIDGRYGNLFEMYERITGESPYEQPMRIFPAPHYTMGGLWVDYNLMSNLDGLFVIGEANFSDHGGESSGASALMQGLADGYFIAPYTVANYLSDHLGETVDPERPAFRETQEAVGERVAGFLRAKGDRTVDSYHRELGQILWDHCGISRTADGLRQARGEIAALREEFHENVCVPGEGAELNATLERAGRLDDFFELGELMCVDALDREESCGAHFREDWQTEDGEAKRDDENFSYASAWEWNGTGVEPHCTPSR